MPLPNFADFFHAVHGHAPLSWQMRLAERVAAARRWPGVVVVPSGANKLACLDIGVWCLALEAERLGSERELPTRIWWVSDEFGAGALTDPAPFGRDGGRDALRPEGGALRRGRGQDALSTGERGPRREGVPPSNAPEGRAQEGVETWVGDLARRLADTGSESGSPALAVAHRLRSLCADEDAAPLEVIDLGSAAACPMPSDPGRPAVILCSLAMYGSRLLFRGRGAERPALDAAMAGTDSLVLVDDRGVAARLAGLVGALGECLPDALAPLPGSRQGATVVGVVDDAATDAASDDVRTPEVLAGLLWEWVKTTTPPEGEAPVEPYFSGIAGGGLGVPVVGNHLDPHPERVCSLSAFASDHLESLGKASAAWARRVAERLGLPSALCETVAFAAQLKDLGMADARFQRRFVDGESATGAWDDPEGWPSGGRHEALSARLVGAWLEKRPEWGEPVERDLLVHLVASHRGAARPLVVPVRDGAPGTVCARIAGVDVEVCADLAKTDWEQPARFRRLNSRFGPWGLALLEAIVTCSDGAVEAGKARGLQA